MLERPRQRDCVHEPAYPEHRSVVFCMGAPNWTAHEASEFCSIEEPHPIAICGEWNLNLREVNSFAGGLISARRSTEAT